MEETNNPEEKAAVSPAQTKTATASEAVAVSPNSGRDALLLINLGTPDSTRPEDVKKYLGEFLMDPRVVDIAAPLRWLLVHGIILRTRPEKSAAAYQKIWTERGSPLSFHLADLEKGVREKLDSASWSVASGMRYGNPSIASAMKALREQDANPRRLIVFPLYPQYSTAATASSIDQATELAKEFFPNTPLSFAEPFYSDPGFIRVFANRVGKKVRESQSEHILFSFHGLPERQIRKGDRSGTCLASEDCCDRIGEKNLNCYRAQCFATARLIAKKVGISPEKYTVGFQSRLGVTPWIRPYSDLLLPELAHRGVKRIAVCCPAFVADCLETLEEVGIRARDSFRAAGGTELVLIPSLNAESDWAEVVGEIATGLARDGRAP